MNRTKIKELRQAHEYTMQDLSKLVCVSEATISRWENGQIQNMRSHNLMKTASALHTTPAEIAGNRFSRRIQP